jgi:hypothetical protein
MKPKPLVNIHQGRHSPMLELQQVEAECVVDDTPRALHEQSVICDGASIDQVGQAGASNQSTEASLFEAALPAVSACDDFQADSHEPRRQNASFMGGAGHQGQNQFSTEGHDLQAPCLDASCGSSPVADGPRAGSGGEHEEIVTPGHCKSSIIQPVSSEGNQDVRVRPVQEEIGCLPGHQQTVNFPQTGIPSSKQISCSDQTHDANPYVETGCASQALNSDQEGTEAKHSFPSSPLEDKTSARRTSVISCVEPCRAHSNGNVRVSNALIGNTSAPDQMCSDLCMEELQAVGLGATALGVVGLPDTDAGLESYGPDARRLMRFLTLGDAKVRIAEACPAWSVLMPATHWPTPIKLVE